MKRPFVIFILILLGLIPASLLGQDKQVGLQLTLIAEHTTIVPGQPFRAGLHIRHDPGYHTYWKNPGIVGIATQLDWDLPPGFTASAISWPHPQRCDMAGYPCHGYQRDVTLHTTITPPQTITDPTITLKATVTWMCCADTCHPGQQQLTLPLTLATKSAVNPASAALLQAAQKETPTESNLWTLQSNQPNQSSKPNQSPLILVLKGPLGEEPEYFFSADGQISSDKNQLFKKTGAQTWQLSIARAEFSPANRKNLSGILKTSQGYHQVSTTTP